MATEKFNPGAVLRRIPQVDILLGRPEVAALARKYSRSFIADLVRKHLAALRTAVASGEASGAEVDLFAGRLAAGLETAIQGRFGGRLTGVINATGVIVHTNLGRSPLAPEAIRRASAALAGYCDLEYDLGEGRRGSRLAYIGSLLAGLFPGSAGIVVNNNAGAVLLALNTLAQRREVLLSRGELVEIGGSFRIPEVMERGGAGLREVGTTNRTRLADYERGISEATALLMKVHCSNYRIVGFVEETPLADLAALGRRKGLPLLVDQGSGNLLDLEPCGLKDEPPVAALLTAGADVVSFSGDKLLGGPQAGLLVGRPDLIESMKKNPLYRALRPDKGCIAALEATLEIFAGGEPLREIPTLAMLSMEAETIRTRAEALRERLRGSGKGKIAATVIEGSSRVGGGSAPGQDLPTWLVALELPGSALNELDAALRCGTPPVVGRVRDDRYLIDLRTVPPERDGEVAKAVEAALPRD